MKEFFDALNTYTYGAGGLMPDGTTAPDVLPDGTLPTYASVPEGIQGATYTGLRQEVAFQTSNFGFGRDLACWDDFSQDFQEIDSNSPLAVAQDAYHRLNTQRGLIPDDPSYGLDLKSLLQRAFGPNGVIETKGRIRGELLKDNRIDPASLVVEVTFSGSDTLVIDIQGKCATGPFSLIMNASDSGVLLQSMAAGA